MPEPMSRAREAMGTIREGMGTGKTWTQEGMETVVPKQHAAKSIKAAAAPPSCSNLWWQ